MPPAIAGQYNGAWNCEESRASQDSELGPAAESPIPEATASKSRLLLAMR